MIGGSGTVLQEYREALKKSGLLFLFGVLTSTLQRDILYYDRYTTTVVVLEGVKP